MIHCSSVAKTRLQVSVGQSSPVVMLVSIPVDLFESLFRLGIATEIIRIYQEATILQARQDSYNNDGGVVRFDQGLRDNWHVTVHPVCCEVDLMFVQSVLRSIYRRESLLLHLFGS